MALVPKTGWDLPVLISPRLMRFSQSDKALSLMETAVVLGIAFYIYIVQWCGFCSHMPVWFDILPWGMNAAPSKIFLGISWFIHTNIFSIEKGVLSKNSLVESVSPVVSLEKEDIFLKIDFSIF